MSQIWTLINSVRNAAGDIFTLEEKQRLHDLVSRYKRNGKISAADLGWLRQCDDNLAAMKKTSRRGRTP
jgi:hypothetical protein